MTTSLPRCLPLLPIPLQPLPSTTRTIGARDVSRLSSPWYIFSFFFFTQLMTISAGNCNIGGEGTWNGRGGGWWKDINGARDASWCVPSPLVFFFYFRSLFTEYLLLFAKKLDKTQIDTKLAHETCAGHISRTTCLIALVSFVSHSPTCTAGPGALTSANLGPAIDHYVMVYSAIVP